MLLLHRSERADRLVDALAEVLLEPPSDPLAKELVAVPTRGVERWITQRLSHRLGARPGAADGVCANIEFPSPAALLAEAMAEVAGGPGDPRPADRAPGNSRDGDAWAPDNCVWPLIGLVDAHIDEEFLRPLADHLRASCQPGPLGPPPRFATVRHLADLYDRYALYRPAILVRWWQEEAEGHGPSPEGEDAWQAELWRRLRRRLGSPSLAERFLAAPQLIRQHPERLSLPGRISIFGLTRMPAGHLNAWKAVSEQRDVHLFVLHPSGALWDRIAMAPAGVQANRKRRADETAELAENPLLRSWGRDAREMQLVLAGGGVTGGVHHAVDHAPASLLGMLQADIRADRAPVGAGAPGSEDHRPVLSADDDSLRAHSCHGRARQVEVVREAVLHLLAADPTLEPRDVVVMCPDIETFAPLVNAAFGPAQVAGAPELRARLADRSVRQTNPLSAAAAHLLELAGSRVTAAQVVDFLSREPVRRRFDLDQDDISTIEQWLEAVGVRWGLDGAHRRGWKLADVEAGTWRAGLDRLLLGAAMTDDGDLFGGALPFGDPSADDVALVGRLAEAVDRLRAAIDQLGGPHNPSRWATLLLAAIARLTETVPADAWQSEELRRALDGLPPGPGEQADDAGGGTAAGPAAAGASGGAGPEGLRGAPLLNLAEARTLLADRLRGRPTRANFRTGDLTICTLVPMRSVPHRVVCLLGLDDGVFPRPAARDGDDLLLGAPEVGDRDPPSEDRQLLLDALLAATEHLVITYEGRDQQLNQPRPPAVPVAELLEVVDRTARAPDGGPARRSVLVEHPLQPFDAHNFEPGALGAPGPWRFDEANLRGARALVGPRSPARSFWPSPLPPPLRPVVPLASLVRFLEHPVKAFLRERLGFYANDRHQLEVALRVELTPLERWGVGERLLQARLSGQGWDHALAAERGRGLLPPGPMRDTTLDELVAVVSGLVSRVEALPEAATRPVAIDVNVALPDGRAVVGTVPGVRQGALMRCTFSRLGPKHRLRAWAQFLAVSAAHPDLVPTAVTIGQADNSTAARPRVSVSTLGPLAGDAGEVHRLAQQALGVLVDLYDKGMAEPLPLYCATSAAWAASTRAAEDSVREARARWAPGFDEIPGESAEPEHQLVLGGIVPFDQLLAVPPAPGESGPGWAAAEHTRLGRLAERLWAPVLRLEKVGSS